MNKIIITTDGTCNCCNNSDTILRIVAGNDFTLRLTLTYKDGSEVKAYDLSDIEDLVVNAVTPNGERIELDSHVSDNHIIAYVESLTFAQYVPYGIEVLWIDVPENNKRAAAPNLFSFVNTSAEANDAEDVIVSGPYDYNLEILSDIAYVNIGEIPTIDMDDYYTKTEIDEGYYTKGAVDTKLDDYAKTSDLSDYVQTSDLSDYVQTSDLSDYVTNSSLNTTLEDYATEDYVDTAISQVTIDETNLVHKTGDESISDTKTFSNTTLFGSGLTASDTITAQGRIGIMANNVLNNVTVGLNAGRASVNQLATANIIAPSANQSANISSNFTSTKDTIVFSKFTGHGQVPAINLEQLAKIDSNGIYEGNTLLSDKYATQTSLNTTLSDYAKTSDLSDYAKTSDLSDYVTNTSLSTTLADYAQTSDLADYVTQTSLSTTLNDYTTTTALNTALTPINNSITSIQSDITSLDGRVTTLEQSGGGGTVPSNVVVSDDADKIVLLTQAEYDALVNNNQVEQDVLYYITDTTSDYVTNSSLNTTLADYATTQYVDDAIQQSGGGGGGTIPTDISQLTDNNGLIPTSTSQLSNDSGFIISTTSLTNIEQLTRAQYNDLVNSNAINFGALYIIIPAYEILEEIHATDSPSCFISNFIPESTFEIEVKFSNNGSFQIPSGGHPRIYYKYMSNSWNDTDMVQVSWENPNGASTLSLSAKFSGKNRYDDTNVQYDQDVIHTIKHTQTQFYYDNNLICSNNSTFTTNTNPLLFSTTEAFKYSVDQGYVNYYDIKLSNNGILEHHYIPVMESITAAIGFYDTVTNTFTQWSGPVAYTKKSTPEYID